MPNTLNQYYTPVSPVTQAAISLTLTNTLSSPTDPTGEINLTLTTDHPTPVSEPQIEVSLTHA